MSASDKVRDPGFFERFALRLGPGRLLAILAALFIADLVVVDPLPFFDEVFLGLLTALAAVWTGRERTRKKPPEKNVTPP